MPETTKRPKRKVRLGIVGGGPGSNIGETHRYAARLDDRYALVAGVFASDAQRSRDFAATLNIIPERRYGSWQEMAEQEAMLQDGLEVVSIMTPNNSHYAIAKECIYAMPRAVDELINNDEFPRLVIFL